MMNDTEDEGPAAEREEAASGPTTVAEIDAMIAQATAEADAVAAARLAELETKYAALGTKYLELLKTTTTPAGQDNFKPLTPADWK